MADLSRREFVLQSARTIAGAMPLMDALESAGSATPALQPPGSSGRPSATDLLSLPKGGGALRSIGERFQADLHTGTANVTLPIELPSGRKGLQLSLSLNYSSGGGNGPFGLGWKLNTASISRSTSKGVPRYRDNAADPGDWDTFVLAGAEDLVPVSAWAFQGTGASRSLQEIANPSQSQIAGAEVIGFRPRTDATFSRILWYRPANAASYWEVTGKDGIRSIYGDRSDARLIDTDDPRRVFTWYLARTEDLFGNVVEYRYVTDDGAGVDASHGATPQGIPADRLERGHRYNQVYLSRIDYADYLDSTTTQRAFLCSVEFDYGEYDADGVYAAATSRTARWDSSRRDQHSSYKPGFEIRTVRRCKRILIKVNEGDPASALVRSYDLEYADAPYNATSLLTRFTMIGYRRNESTDQVNALLPDGSTVAGPYRRQALPPVDMDYTQFAPSARQYVPLTAADGLLPSGGLADAEYETVDLHGFGLPGVLRTTRDGYTYWQNRGDGQLGTPCLLRETPAGISLASPAVALVDMEGNGRADLLVTSPSGTHYYATRFSDDCARTWDEASRRGFARDPSFSLLDRGTRLVDMDGDGVVDVVRTHDDSLLIWYNLRGGGWSQPQVVTRRHDLDCFPDVSFADMPDRVRLADMTGDGLQDVVLVHDGSIEYWPHMGRGKFGPRIVMRNAPKFGAEFDPRRLLIGDVDGDGCADLIYAGESTTVCFNQAGNRWSDPVVIEGTPSVTDPASVRVIDMLGIGTGGILWSYDARYAGGNYKFLDLTGGVKPYLLSKITNNFGASTTVEYRPSTWFFRRDRDRGLVWRTRLPFPVHCVSRTVVHDSHSGSSLTTEYIYHEGHWSGEDREFRGFARVDRRDAEVFSVSNSEHSSAFDSPPTETRTWFHVGAVDDDLGRPVDCNDTRDYWEGDGRLFQRNAATTALASRRSGLRALRSRILRTELYALDGSPLEGRPYTVTEVQHGLRDVATSLISGQGDAGRVVFSYTAAERVTEWERGSDPMTKVTYSDDFDVFGQPASRIEIGVPRGHSPESGGAPTAAFLARQVVTQYASPNVRRHILDRVARTILYEVSEADRRAAGSGAVSALETLHERIRSGRTTRTVVGDELHYYDGPAGIGLPLGQLGEYGVSVRRETLTLTSAIAAAAYGSAVPPYIAANPVTNWPAEYPADFRSNVASAADGAGYYRRSGSAGTPGLYSCSECRELDFQHSTASGRGNVVATRDRLGLRTTIAYDRYALLPTLITAPSGAAGPSPLVTAADYDYRSLRPSSVTEPNGNRTIFRYTPLGLLSEISVQSHDGRGDQSWASTQFSYDLTSFARGAGPVWTRTRRFVTYDPSPTTPIGDCLESLEFTDGFGRLLQTRTRAENELFATAVPNATCGGEPILVAESGLAANATASSVPAVGRRAPTGKDHVVVSGWTRFDNKGRAVEVFESFFSIGWAYAPTDACAIGARTRMHYDPRGELLATVHADDSEQRIVFGTVSTLDRLLEPTPTPWETLTYDVNDNAGRTHPVTSGSYQSHWNTPTTTVFDAFRRTVSKVERPTTDPSTWLTTHSHYDTRDNVVEAIDGIGRSAFRYVYDLRNRVVQSSSIDAGIVRIVLDAADGVLEKRDERRSLTLQAYDGVGRPVALWARDDGSDAITLRERRVYGDSSDSGLSSAQAKAANLLGKLYEVYDEAGRIRYESYDFRDSVVQTVRQVIKPELVLTSFASPPANWAIVPVRVDWTPPPGGTLAARATALLDTHEYRVTTEYDALKRVIKTQLPNDSDGQRKVIVPRYNVAGALESVELDGSVYVRRIAYNAKGQRVLLVLGNGFMTRYAYDSSTFRLLRMKTEKYQANNDITFQANGSVLQDLSYEYDLAGNVLAITDRTAGSGTGATPNELRRSFAYDGVYRLRTATGRECSAALASEYDPSPRCTDPTATHAYVQQFKYDACGNLVALDHRTVSSSAWCREFSLVAGMNRLAGVTTGQMTTPLDYDAAGNLTREGTTRFLEWDHANRMRTFRTQVNQDEPTTWMQCLYDAQGHRVMKIVRNRGAAVEITVYIGAMFERHTADVGAAAVAYDMIHVLDDKRRVAQRRVGTPFAGDTAPVTTYHYDDHLGSAVLITDAQGSWLNREEQYPLGGTSFGGFARKKYRFLGKELDHNGFYCIGARYYAPHLGRWSSCDPSGLSGGINVYQYAGANPIRLVDHSGRSPTAADVADAWEQAGTWPSLPGERSLSGEQISAGISTWMYDVNTAFLEALPEGQGFFPSLVRQWGALQSTSLQSAVDVVGGIAGCVADPGSIVRGVMRIGNASAQGVEEIRGGNTTVGLAHIGGDVGNALLITAGALRVGGRIAQMPKVPPLSKLFDGHVPKQGFSGVFDPKTGKAQMRPSFDPDFNTGPKPSDWVNRRRGHLEVSTEMGRDVHHQAFTVKLEANGTLSVDWYSGSVNTQNPLFGGSAIVPEQFRPAIIKAIEAATGRTVN